MSEQTIIRTQLFELNCEVLYSCYYLTTLQLKLRQLTPPYKPRIDSDRDPSNFDPQFVVEPTEFTPDP